MNFDSHSGAPAAKTYTVAQLNREVRAALESSYVGVCLCAEVLEVTRARSGHIYFKLGDGDGRASIDAVMWRGQGMRYGSRIERGAKINCFGRVTIYEAGGRYQFVSERVEEAGAGEKARLLAELKERLQKEGLFAAERKRPLPPVPRCVGVVTSRSGAALRDIIKVIDRRFPVRLLIAHATVQGNAAPGEIADALHRIGSVPEVEVVIVGRGGGSSEDLDAFNDETVVRAIVACPVPVISAVGHEVDFSLSDSAADKRAATPSEAAEMVVPEFEGLVEQLINARRMLGETAGRATRQGRANLAVLEGRLRSRDPRVRLREGLETLSGYREVLARWPSKTLARQRERLSGLDDRLRNWGQLAVPRVKGDLASASEGLYRWPDPALARAQGALGGLAGKLDGLSPLANLARGFSIIHGPGGGLIKSAAQAPVGTNIDVTLASGSLKAQVKETLEE